jgi:hypothetical protein
MGFGRKIAGRGTGRDSGSAEQRAFDRMVRKNRSPYDGIENVNLKSRRRLLGGGYTAKASGRKRMW